MVRRLAQVVGGLLLVAFAIGQVALTGEVHAQAKPLKKVKIAVGTTVINVGYPWLTLPIALDYWKAEGYDVEVLPVGASLQALQQMVAGNADFAQLNSSVVIQANVVNGVPARVVMNNGVIDWSLATLEDGPIRDVKDLKGKTIGVFSLATGGIAFMKSYMRQNGMDPDKDVSLVAVGLGAPPVEALRTGKVQALLFWASANATFENAGLKLRYLRGADWRKFPDFTFSTLQKTIDTDPAMVEAIARGCPAAGRAPRITRRSRQPPLRAPARSEASRWTLAPVRPSSCEVTTTSWPELASASAMFWRCTYWKPASPPGMSS
jgi:NitT/TauT family transport system substrate-binding protein